MFVNGETVETAQATLTGGLYGTGAAHGALDACAVDEVGDGAGEFVIRSVNKPRRQKGISKLMQEQTTSEQKVKAAPKVA